MSRPITRIGLYCMSRIRPSLSMRRWDKTHLLADGIWPKTIGIGSRVLHGVSQRLSGNSELKLAYKDGRLVLNRTHLSALEVEFTPDRRYEFSRLELEAEYNRAQEVDPARKDELSHRDMLALAEMFAGWSLNGKLPPYNARVMLGTPRYFGRWLTRSDPTGLRQRRILLRC